MPLAVTASGDGKRHQPLPPGSAGVSHRRMPREAHAWHCLTWPSASVRRAATATARAAAERMSEGDLGDLSRPASATSSSGWGLEVELEHGARDPETNVDRQITSALRGEDRAGPPQRVPGLVQPDLRIWRPRRRRTGPHRARERWPSGHRARVALRSASSAAPTTAPVVAGGERGPGALDRAGSRLTVAVFSPWLDQLS